MLLYSSGRKVYHFCTGCSSTEGTQRGLLQCPLHLKGVNLLAQSVWCKSRAHFSPTARLEYVHSLRIQACKAYRTDGKGVSQHYDMHD